MALIISPNRLDSPVFARNPQAGFTVDEIHQLVRAHGKALRLQNGWLLIVDSLFCGASVEGINLGATCTLCTAVDAPGLVVCGPALLLDAEESERLSDQVRAALLLPDQEQIRTVLLLDRNEEVRSLITLGLETHRCRVIQARTAADAVGFCRSHRAEVLIADVSSLEPHPLDTLRYMREAQPHAGVLAISGLDRFHVEQWFPKLLEGIQFLQKPFSFGQLGVCLQILCPSSPLAQRDVAAMAYESTDS